MNQKKLKSDHLADISPCEMQLSLIAWAYGALSSFELRELCKKKLGWSKSTTYTYIHRLSEKGILINENAVVKMLVPKETIQQAKLNLLIEREFEGSPSALFNVLNHMYWDKQE